LLFISGSLGLAFSRSFPCPECLFYLWFFNFSFCLPHWRLSLQFFFHLGLADERDKERNAGVVESIGGMGWLSGNLLGGAVMERFGDSAPFLSFSFLAFILFVVEIIILKKRKIFVNL